MEHKDIHFVYGKKLDNQFYPVEKLLGSINVYHHLDNGTIYMSLATDPKYKLLHKFFLTEKFFETAMPFVMSEYMDAIVAVWGGRVVDIAPVAIGHYQTGIVLVAIPNFDGFKKEKTSIHINPEAYKKFI